MIPLILVLALETPDAAGVVPTAVPVTEWRAPDSDPALPAGPLFHPVRPDNMATPPMPVPEPVWSSVGAAAALILMGRRGGGGGVRSER